MALKVSPIKPSQIGRLQDNSIPDVVIEIFNTLLTKTCHNGHATIRQDEVVKELVLKGFERKEIFEKRWLDIENIYRKAGWTVTYDKPAYNETYEPFWNFKHKGA